MFRDVVDPSIHVGQKHSYTLPLSIAVHVALVAMLIVIPLVAPAALPAPATAAILAFAAPSVAPPPPPPPAPVRAAQIEQPKNIIYPVIAQIAKVQGVVIIEATIGPNGKVQDVKVLRSHPLLEAAALDAVRQWEFTPTLLNGSPVSVVMTVTVDFRLR
jgi:periplasmic protein TonB